MQHEPPPRNAVRSTCPAKSRQLYSEDSLKLPPDPLSVPLLIQCPCTTSLCSLELGSATPPITSTHHGGYQALGQR